MHIHYVSKRLIIIPTIRLKPQKDAVSHNVTSQQPKPIATCVWHLASVNFGPWSAWKCLAGSRHYRRFSMTHSCILEIRCCGSPLLFGVWSLWWKRAGRKKRRVCTHINAMPLSHIRRAMWRTFRGRVLQNVITRQHFTRMIYKKLTSALQHSCKCWTIIVSHTCKRSALISEVVGSSRL